MSHRENMLDMARRAKQAARVLARLDTQTKNQALLAMADNLGRKAAAIQTENRKDVEAARTKGLSAAMIDRLTLSDTVMAEMVRTLREGAALPDPVGEVIGMR
ncbi:MAG: gamma-glutamyl-phosphate reductase, partial [Pseudomonadota bacterium]